MVGIVIGVFYPNPFCQFFYLFSVNRMFDKDTKQGMMYRYMLLQASTLKKDKRPIRQLKTDVQVNRCFFMVQMIIY